MMRCFTTLVSPMLCTSQYCTILVNIEEITETIPKMTDTEEPQSGPAPTTPNDKDANKICILLNSVGNVPIIKKRTWTVDPNKTISWIQKFIHKYLKLDSSEQIFLYVNQTFAPAPDQIIKNLYDCHETNGKLVLYYCKNPAWG